VIDTADRTLRLRDIQRCFEGAVPAVIATAAADGTPNVTYLSCVRLVDDDHVALSNQFFSKTSRNLAENPRGSLLVIDPATYDQYRVTLVYERTERRGPVFERLSDDVNAVAELSGMQDVFKLRAADLYRALDIELMPAAAHHDPPNTAAGSAPDRELAISATRLAELSARLSRCPDLNTLVGATVDGLDELLGYPHSLLLLLDEDGGRLYTIAAHGYEAEGVGSEVVVGEGIIGMAAARCTPVRIGNLRQMRKYSATVKRSFAVEGIGPGRELPLPGLDEAQSQLAVPLLALGQLVGVLMVESTECVAFGDDDASMLSIVASLLANAIESGWARERAEEASATRGRQGPVVAGTGVTATHVRFFATDGSTFLDGDYLIKGVAGRILWSLLGQHQRDGRTEFTNREVRLDPSLELPELRDNLESRLILLKRRLDERDAPIRIEKAGRGRFHLEVTTPLHLEGASATVPPGPT